MKDWTGNQRSLWANIGASSHTEEEREANDYYATDPRTIDCLLQKVDLPHVILEPSCGAGHLSKRLEELGHKVYSYDKIDRGYGEVQDYFFRETLPDDCSCILTNPPYKYATEFVLKSLELLPEGGMCCMFLKTTFLEGKTRWEKIYRTQPPFKVLQFSCRTSCAKNGDFKNYRSGAVAYAWFIWVKGFKGLPTIDWISEQQYGDIRRFQIL